MRPASLTALEALAIGLVAALEIEPKLPPLVPEWDGEVSLEHYVVYADAQARRLASRIVEVAS